jgi:uncharacterized repeat protein (TIGR04076 family)
MGESHRLIITVKEIHGNCPVFKVGDTMIFEEPEIFLKNNGSMCVHALASMLTMLVPLSRGVGFKELGLAKEEAEAGYLQCLDPGEPYTHGGTVIFQISRDKALK